MNETTTIWSVTKIISIPAVILIVLQIIISNILVIYSILTFPSLKNCPNLLLISLALADIGNAIFVMPLNAFWKIIEHWPFNKAVCIMHLTSDSFLSTTSILNLVVIALDRYWAIFDPIKYSQKRSPNFMIKIALCAWTIGFIITVVPCTALPAIFNIFPWPEGGCHYPPGYILYVTFGQFVIPLIIMSIVYVLIYGAIKKQLQWRRNVQLSNNVIISEPERISRTSQDTNITVISDESNNFSLDLKIEPQRSAEISFGSERNQNKKVVNEREKISIARERRAVRLLSTVVGAFVVCWAPYFIIDNIFYFWPSLLPKTPVSVINITYWLGYVNSACNPIIYTIFNKDFRNAFKHIFHVKRH